MSYKINMLPDGRPAVITISQNDIGREIVCELYEGKRSTAYTIPDGATVTIAGTKPSGLGFTVTGTVSGSTVTFETTEGMSDEDGYIPCEIVVSLNDDRIGSCNPMLAVESNPHPDDTTDDTAEHLVNTITGLVNSAEEAASDAEGFADEAENYADLAEQTAATSGYMWFEIDDNGHLILHHTDNVDVTFTLVNGHLYVEAA